MACFIMKTCIFLALFVALPPIFGLSVLTGSDSQNTTYSLETVREVKNFDVLRQLLNQETLIRMSMTKDMLSLKQSFQGEVQTTAELKKDLQKMERENERLSNENIKYSEKSDKMNKTLHILHNEFEQSKQSFLGEVSTLKQTTAELKMDLRLLKRENERLSNENVKYSENVNLVLGNSDEMNKTIDNLSSALSSLNVTVSKNSRGAIAFHARISSDLQNLGNYAAVVFGKVTLNSGSAYDGKTGIFTAPKDGIYSFTWTILTKSGYHFHTEIVINGNLVGYNYADGKNGSSNYESSSTTAVIRMKKKDKVWIRTHGTYGKYAHANWSSFSGYEL